MDNNELERERGITIFSKMLGYLQRRKDHCHRYPAGHAPTCRVVRWSDNAKMKADGFYYWSMPLKGTNATNPLCTAKGIILNLHPIVID